MPQNYKLRVPRIISRLDLYLLLSQQYPGGNPFIIKRTDETSYDVLNSELEFVCCTQYNHNHKMSPYNMLRLKNLYGTNPCPLCYSQGKRSNNGGNGLEDIAHDEDMRKYILSDDPKIAAKQKAKLELEIAREQEKLRKKEEMDRSIPLASSCTYEDYIKNNPEFEKELHEDISTRAIEEVADTDEIIASSIPYDEYIKDNPDFMNTQDSETGETIIAATEYVEEKKPINPFDIDAIFAMGSEDLVESYEIDNIKNEFIKKETNESIIETKEEIVEESEKQKQIISKPEIDETKSTQITKEIQQNPEPEYSSEDTELYEIESFEEQCEKIDAKQEISNDEIQKSNIENTHILFNDNKHNISSDDEEEDYEIGAYE